MLIFSGQAEATIDQKQRLAVPSKFRSQWDTARDGAALYCIPWPDGRLRLYPETRFVEIASKAEDSLMPDEDLAALETTLYSFAERLDLDANGRVRIPKQHLDMTGLGTDVVVVGVRNRLEVHDRATWNESRDTQFRALPGLVERAGQKARGQGPGAGAR